jgi:hypothetical protein
MFSEQVNKCHIFPPIRYVILIVLYTRRVKIKRDVQNLQNPKWISTIIQIVRNKVLDVGQTLLKQNFKTSNIF